MFSAIGTVGAFLVGFLLLRYEHRREAGRAEDERRAQAARISASVEAYRKPRRRPGDEPGALVGC
jgi:hypothetical protein